jgi:hypothetical protein
MSSSTHAQEDTYALLRQVIAGLPSAVSSSERRVHWVDESHQLGLSREEHGRVEVFLSGPPLECSSIAVVGNLAHDTWQGIDAQLLVANRLLMPPESHFDAIAAFLCTHLIENGFLGSRQLGFTRSEPVIEMAFERSRFHGEGLVGLCGELLLMRSLLDRRPGRLRDVLASWHGYERSARDFQLGTVGVEVKTTRGSTSTHKVQGIRQVEVGHGVDGGLETDFFLVSIGIEAVAEEEPLDNTWTLPGLVESLLSRIDSTIAAPDESAELGVTLVRAIRNFGTEDADGYDHEEMQHRVIFGQRWRTAFVRSYDMKDPAIKVLRSSDMTPFSMVDRTSVEFTLTLPVQVKGDLNPMVGLGPAAQELLRQAWD